MEEPRERRAETAAGADNERDLSHGIRSFTLTRARRQERFGFGARRNAAERLPLQFDHHLLGVAIAHDAAASIGECRDRLSEAEPGNFGVSSAAVELSPRSPDP